MLTDRGRLKYRFFSEKSDFFGSGRKNSEILTKNRTFTDPRMKPRNSGYGLGALKYRAKTGVYLLKREGWQPWSCPKVSLIYLSKSVRRGLNLICCDTAMEGSSFATTEKCINQMN